MNLLTPLRRAVTIGAARPAVVGDDGARTYAEMAERIGRLGAALADRLGTARGDRVAIIAANSAEYLEIYQAVPGFGRVLVPLNARHTVPELTYALRDAGATVLFTDLDPTPFEAIVPTVVRLPTGYEALLGEAAPAEPPTDIADTDLAGLFYTGGTTGAAKGVMLTHRNLIANAFHLMAIWPFTPDTRWAVIAPLFHAAGSFAVLATVWAGGSHVVLPRFDPAAALDLMDRQSVTHTLVVPTMLAAMADEQLARPRRLDGFTHVSYGGSPSATEVLRRARQAFPNASMLHLYGTTETAPIATALPGNEGVLDTERARSCGQPAIGIELKVVNPQNEPVELGEVGEVCVRGANVMAGYWQKPAETAAVLRDGWYHTGDLGYLDREGYLFLVDRAKDMIVTGGENVYGTEVEDALYRHPAVVEAAVYGVPDSTWGEAVMASVVVRTVVSTNDLAQHCRALIAGYKVPKRWDLREVDAPLPKSGAGKILKRELRAPHWEGHDRAIGGATPS